MGENSGSKGKHMKKKAESRTPRKPSKKKPPTLKEKANELLSIADERDLIEDNPHLFHDLKAAIKDIGSAQRKLGSSSSSDNGNIKKLIETKYVNELAKIINKAYDSKAEVIDPFLVRNERDLNEWYNKKIESKGRTPKGKLLTLYLNSDVSGAKLPESFRVALDLFFVHTAGFIPLDRQGRDIDSNNDKGWYFRSNDTKIKMLPLNNPRIEALPHKKPKEGEGEIEGNLFGMAVRRINRKYYGALMAEVGHSMPKGLRELTLVGETNFNDSQIGVYKSHAGIQNASLGVFTNAVKTVRSARNFRFPEVEANYRKLDEEQHRKREVLIDISNTIKNSETATMLEDYLEGSNYHDFLLKNRAELVRNMSAWIKDYEGEEGEVRKPSPVQFDGHASLVLFDNKPGRSPNKDDVWRNEVEEAFNRAARTVEGELGSRIVHRGSFGFLNTTISSVGEGVRIWPGTIPEEAFGQIMKETIKILYGESQSVSMDAPTTFRSSDAPGNNMHMQTLLAS